MLWRAKVPIIIIAIYLYFRDRWGIVADSWLGQYRSATVFLFTSLFIWQTGKMFLQSERYKSTQAIADNRHGSCGKYEEKGDYVVLNIGSLSGDADIPWRSGHETWVVRRESFKKIGEQIYVGTQLDKSDILEVPPYIKDFIESTSGYNKENIYYGEFSQIAKIDDPEKNEVTDKLRDNQRLNNELKAMLRGKTSAIKGFVSDTAAIQKKAKGESLIGKSGGEESY